MVAAFTLISLELLVWFCGLGCSSLWFLCPVVYEFVVALHFALSLDLFGFGWRRF